MLIMGRMEKRQAAKDTIIIGSLASSNRLVTTENATKAILNTNNSIAVLSRVVRVVVLAVFKEFTWITHCLQVSNKTMQTQF